jgi:hypothetical protein
MLSARSLDAEGFPDRRDYYSLGAAQQTKAKVLNAVKMKPGNQYQTKLPRKTYRKNLYLVIFHPSASTFTPL